MRKLVLVKNSIVHTKQSVPNQCKVQGHEAYNYEIEITTGLKLDESGFIIDHSEVHHVIEDVVANQMGSCEQLCERIEQAVCVKLRQHGVQVRKIELAIKPVDSNAWVKIIADHIQPD